MRSYIKDSTALEGDAAPPPPPQLIVLPMPSTTPRKSDKNWISFIRTSLMMDKNARTCLPNATVRRTIAISDMGDPQQQRMVKFACDAILTICNGISPKDPESLLALCADRLCGDKNSRDKTLRERLKAVTDALPQKSLRRKVLCTDIRKKRSTFGL